MQLPEVRKILKEYIEESSNKNSAIEAIKDYLHEESLTSNHPVDRVRWVPIDEVVANDYNPNSVAKPELRLLFISIKSDGYTQPVVTVRDEAKKQYVVVDGFHRYYVMKNSKEIMESTRGLLPIVVLNKSINDRMASTIRHNRARGEHSVDGMANLVYKMLDGGWNDARVCNELGLEIDELIRLKHVTGFSKLFKDTEYRKEWIVRNQIMLNMMEKERLGIEILPDMA